MLVGRLSASASDVFSFTFSKAKSAKNIPCVIVAVNTSASWKLFHLRFQGLKGAETQLDEYCESTAFGLLERTSIYQQQASHSHLGLPRVQNSNLQKVQSATTAAKLSARYGKSATPRMGVSVKTKSLMDEIRAVKEKRNRIKITAGLYYFDKNKKFKKIPEVYFSRMFGEERLIYNALDDLIAEAKAMYSKSFPLLPPISRQIITFYAHEMKNFLLRFAEQNWISKTAAEARSLEIRLVCDSKDVQATFGDDNDDVAWSLKPSRPKDSAWQLSSRPSPYPLEQAIAGRSTSAPPLPSQPSEPVIRMSAWRPSFNPKTHFSRDPPLDCCSFTRFEPKVGMDGVVTFTRSEKSDIILVANDWANAMHEAKEDHRHDSGYIGKGSVKLAVYARYNGIEYALTQGLWGHTIEDNLKMLQAEYQNLLFGETLRSRFEALAEEYSQSLPKFRFNLGGAILGEFLAEPERELGANMMGVAPLMRQSQSLLEMKMKVANQRQETIWR
ncbi:hypothetical protein APHAL10511_003479 [Amanita phalloides]|nr:hypothetical protein APHAL10511_003479 [Amanita phalloides]